MRYAGEAVTGFLRRERDAGPVAGLRVFLAPWRGVVDSGFRAGCPVPAVSVEKPQPDEVPPAMCRAKRDAYPLDQVAQQLETLIEAGLAPAA
ncbi:hypothetical protein [Streptomyces sp. NPDC002566]|uniref:hypothetical protein n=1 Tax=Streptomyces sp. NPDC002566 TaxID=3364650 RepID=UPI0036B8FFB6